MSILTKPEIIEERKLGNIVIEPFNPDFLGPNSMDVTLHPMLKTYVPLIAKRDKNFDDNYVVFLDTTIDSTSYLDLAKDDPVFELEIPEEGLIIIPGIMYLGSTNERAGSSHLIPMYEGRSSIARKAIHSHISAGFGDIGFQSNWTLEISVIHPVKIYRNVRIGQVYWHRVDPAYLKILHETGDLYNGKYIDQSTAQSSKSYLDFHREDGLMVNNNFR